MNDKIWQIHEQLIDKFDWGWGIDDTELAIQVYESCKDFFSDDVSFDYFAEMLSYSGRLCDFKQAIDKLGYVLMDEVRHDSVIQMNWFMSDRAMKMMVGSDKELPSAKGVTSIRFDLCGDKREFFVQDQFAIAVKSMSGVVSDHVLRKMVHDVVISKSRVVVL